LNQAAVFLDRDGTLIEDVGYLVRLEQLVLFPWTIDAIRLLNRVGLPMVVVTNQAAIGRGLIDERFIGQVHDALDTRLRQGGARIDRYYFCPHHPNAKLDRYRQVCGCRKPAPGMIERACAELDLDASRSWTVGDNWNDVACGHAAGTRSILIKTGHGARDAVENPVGAPADAILNNLMEAVSWILRASTSR
jgi:D-glycero-D-manno-heptose 1,7-bisphosphate phosphatase